MKKLLLLVCAAALAACGGKELKVTSAILGAELPGALSAERHKASTVSTVQEMAKTFSQECGPVEAFEVVDSTKMRAELTKLISEKNYRRNLITTVDNGEVYALSGPKRLLVVDAGASLGICEILGS